MPEIAASGRASPGEGRSGRRGADLMSQTELEGRVGKVEDGLARLSADVRVLAHDQVGLKEQVGEIGQGVKQLLDRDAKRPDALTGKTILATLITTGAAVTMLTGFVWWMIASAPAVQDLDRRVTDLDHPKRGAVPALERRVETIEGWRATTTVQRR